MSNRDVLNDNVRLVRLVEKLTIQRDDLRLALRRRYSLCGCVDNRCTICIEDRAILVTAKD